MSDRTKFSTADDVREELARDLKSALLVIGMRVVGNEQHVEIVFKKGLLESLNLAGQACVLEALQQAAEYVAASMGVTDRHGSSGVA